MIPPFVITTFILPLNTGQALYSSDPAAMPLNGYAAPAGVINFDDVLIDNDLHNPDHLPLSITRIIYGILREPGATETTLTAYWGTVDLPPVHDDPAILSSIHPIKSVNLDAYTGMKPVIEFIPIGNGVTPLFTVTPNFNDVQFYGEFAVGLSSSSNDGYNPWAIANYTHFVSPANFDWAWTYDGGISDAYSLEDSFGNPIYTTYVLSVDGGISAQPASVPEPSLIFAVAAMAMRRSRPILSDALDFTPVWSMSEIRQCHRQSMDEMEQALTECLLERRFQSQLREEDEVTRRARRRETVRKYKAKRIAV